MSAQGSINGGVAVKLAGSNAFSGGPFWNGSFDFALSFASGVAAGQIDMAYVAERTVASAANDDIDLAGGLTDALGVAITMAEVAAIVIVNKPKDGTDNTTALTIGGGSTETVPLPAQPAIGPGGCLMIADPDAGGLFTVTAATADILRVANAAGASNKYQICVLGRSA